MYIKRAIILKPTNKNFEALICYIEHNTKECTIKIQPNIKETLNLFIVIQGENQEPVTSKLNLESTFLSTKLDCNFNCYGNIKIMLGVYQEISYTQLYFGSTSNKNFDSNVFTQNSELTQNIKNLFTQSQLNKRITDTKTFLENTLQCQEIDNQSFEPNCKLEDDNKTTLNFEQDNIGPIDDINEEKPNSSLTNQDSELSTQKTQSIIALNTEIIEDCDLNKNESSLEKHEDFPIKEELNLHNKTNLENTTLQSKENTFFEQISPSLNALLENNEEDLTLQELIENSKFAKIYYEDSQEFYSVGLIYEDGQEKYICFALPCTAGNPPPNNLAKYSQYLPVDDNLGYYLMYQNADTGENVEFE